MNVPDLDGPAGRSDAEIARNACRLTVGQVDDREEQRIVVEARRAHPLTIAGKSGKRAVSQVGPTASVFIGGICYEQRLGMSVGIKRFQATETSLHWLVRWLRRRRSSQQWKADWLSEFVECGFYVAQPFITFSAADSPLAIESGIPTPVKKLPARTKPGDCFVAA